MKKITFLLLNVFLILFSPVLASLEYHDPKTIPVQHNDTQNYTITLYDIKPYLNDGEHSLLTKDKLAEFMSCDLDKERLLTPEIFYDSPLMIKEYRIMKEYRTGPNDYCLYFVPAIKEYNPLDKDFKRLNLYDHFYLSDVEEDTKNNENKYQPNLYYCNLESDSSLYDHPKPKRKKRFNTKNLNYGYCTSDDNYEYDFEDENLLIRYGMVNETQVPDVQISLFGNLTIEINGSTFSEFGLFQYTYNRETKIYYHRFFVPIATFRGFHKSLSKDSEYQENLKQAILTFLTKHQYTDNLVSTYLEGKKTSKYEEAKQNEDGFYNYSYERFINTVETFFPQNNFPTL